MALNWNKINVQNNQPKAMNSGLDWSKINKTKEINPVVSTLKNASVIQAANDVKKPALTYEQAQQISKENNIKMPNKLTLPNANIIKNNIVTPLDKIEEFRKEHAGLTQEEYEKALDSYDKGNWGANYTLGNMQIKYNDAMSKYFKSQDEKDLAEAEELRKQIDRYQKYANNVNEGNWITKDFAVHTPQMLGQIKSGITGAVIGATAGAATGAAVGSVVPGAGTVTGATTGTIWGAKTGYVGNVAKFSYDQMRGSAYADLLDLGVPNDIALEVANDTALWQGIIEGAGAGVDLATLGIGKLFSKGAKTAGQLTAKKLITNALKSYGINLASETAEEAIQEKVAIEGEKKALEKAGMERTATAEEDMQRIIDAGSGGFKIALISGSGNVIGNVTTNSINTSTVKQTNKFYDEYVEGIKNSNLTEKQKQEMIADVEQGRAKTLEAINQKFNNEKTQTTPETNLQTTPQNYTNFAKTTPVNENISQNKVENSSNFEKTGQNFVYHGTLANVKGEDLIASDFGDLGKGLYFAREKEIAEQFSDIGFRNHNLERMPDGRYIDINTGKIIEAGPPHLIEASIDNLKIKQMEPAEWNKAIESLRDPKTKSLPIDYETVAQGQFKQQGYDGIELINAGNNNQVVIFPDSIKKIKYNTGNTQNIVTNDKVDQFSGYTEKEIKNFEGGKISVARSNNDILDFVKKARTASNNLKLYMSKVKKNVSDAIKTKFNINVEGYNISLKNDDVRKVYKDHGTEETEVPRGQVPITEEDFTLIPLIINEPDNIELRGTSEQGKPAIAFEKNINGNRVVVTYVSDKHKNLELQTMYKFKNDKKIDSSTALYEKTPRLNTSEMDSSTNLINNIIPTSQNYVNNNLPTQAEQQQAQQELRNKLPTEQAKEDGLKEAIENISENKQANKVSYTNDFYRNMKNALGEKAGKELTGQFDSRKLNHVKTRQKFSNELKSYVVDELGIKLGSEMSADVQKYGEKLITEADLKRKYPNTWQNIIKADKWFRSKYNELIDGINETRKEIYPHVEEKIQETKDALLKTYDLIKQAEKAQIAPYKIDQDIQENIKRLDERIAAKQEKIKEIEDKNRPNYESTKTYTNLVEQLELLEDNKKELERLIGKRYDEKVAKLKKRAQRLSDTLNGEELWRGKRIPKRDNYYRHFQEMTEGFKALHNIFTTPAEISSQLAGTSEYTKPKSKFLGLAQKRTTNETEYDAVGGFLNYLEPASYAINIDPFITELRDISQTIKNNTQKSENANKLTEYLDDFASSLAGKTNPFDRPAQKLVGRKTMKAIEWTANRIKSNAVLGNINSSISQVLNLPQVVGKIKDPVKLAQGVGDLLFRNGKYQDSQFIQERYHNDIMSQFKAKLIQQPKKFATWMLGALDEAVTKTGWNAVYRQAIQKGIENPIQYADDTMRSLVAGRGIGERTLSQESKLTNLLMPFTVETGNYWRVMKDFVNEKDFGGILITFIVGWLLNRGIEAIGASGKTFDPIDAIYDAITEEDLTMMERFGRVGGEILSSVPGGQQIASIYPEYGADFGIFELPSRENLFGSNDPTRFGTGNIFTNAFSPAIPGTPIPSIALPWGGTQLKRTVEGAKTLKEGGDYKTTTAGEKQLKFPINMEELTPTQKFLKSAQVLTLGKYSVPEADYYFENGGLSKVQTEGLEKAKDIDISVKEFYDIMEKIEAIEVPKRKNKEGKEEPIPGARKKLIIDELNKTDLNNEQRKLMYDIFYSKELK